MTTLGSFQIYLFILAVVDDFRSFSGFPWFHQQSKPKVHLTLDYLLQDKPFRLGFLGVDLTGYIILYL